MHKTNTIKTISKFKINDFVNIVESNYKDTIIQTRIYKKKTQYKLRYGYLCNKEWIDENKLELVEYFQKSNHIENINNYKIINIQHKDNDYNPYLIYAIKESEI